MTNYNDNDDDDDDDNDNKHLTVENFRFGKYIVFFSDFQYLGSRNRMIYVAAQNWL